MIADIFLKNPYTSKFLTFCIVSSLKVCVLFVLVLQTVREGPATMHNMYPDIYDQLLTYIDYGIRVPKFGKIETKQFGTVKGPMVIHFEMSRDQW